MGRPRAVSTASRLLLGAVILAALAAPAAGRPATDPPDGRGSGDQAAIVESLLETRIHGITEEIARTEIGTAGLPLILERLRDPSFPRRDNLVGFLTWLATDDQVAMLVGLLADPPAAVTVPEEDRALLLVPEALGRTAARGSARALAALLEMTDPSRASVLDRAAAHGPDPVGLRRDLREMALRGLAVSGAGEARLRLEQLAAPGPAGATDPAARENLELWDRLQRGAASDETPSSPYASGLTVLDADGWARVHASPLTYTNHVDHNDPISSARVDAVLAQASLRMGRADFAGDVACCATLTNGGTVGTFGTPGDGLDVVTTNSEMDQVLGDDTARVKIVRVIQHCGGPGTNIIGCASTPGDTMALVRLSSLPSEAILWAHEYGHNTGLGHHASPANIMYGTNFGTNNGLEQSQCDRFHAPAFASGMDPLDVGACTDDDADGVHDVIDNCPTVGNTGQSDANGDGVGDACDFGCGNGIAEAGEDCDANDLGGETCASRGFDGGTLACDPACLFDESGCFLTCFDGDNDGFTNCDGDCDDVDDQIHPGAFDDCDGKDNDCDGTADPGCGDPDGDGILDRDDNCPAASNAGQEDGDGDGVGDVCDTCAADPLNDADGDGVCGDVDNCPDDANPGQTDSDGDGTGNACEDPISLEGPPIDTLYHPDDPPPLFSWDPAGMEEFKLDWATTPTFEQPRKSSGKTWVRGGDLTPPADLWVKVLKLGKSLGTVHWRVRGKDSLGNHQTTGTLSFRVASAQAPVVTGPPDGATAGTPPTIVWSAGHNAEFRVVFATRPDLTGKPKAASGKGYTLAATSWSVTPEAWAKIVDKLAPKSPTGTVYYAVQARDALGRRSQTPARTLVVAAP